MVCFQFQTDGTLVDFSSIQIQYINKSFIMVSLPANEYLREYRTSGSSLGGLTNRNSLQWDLTGPGVTSYQIVFHSLGSSNSLQQAVLDIAATYGAIVLASCAWTTAGMGNWATGANWRQGTNSVENGIVRFVNTGATTAILDANHPIGELRFDVAVGATINSPGGFVLTSNTGITTLATATGTYTVNSAYALGAFNLFVGAAGALGNATTDISGGANSALFTLANASAELVLDGDRTLGRGIDLASGGYERRLAAGTFSISQQGNDLYLNYSPVPEPST